MGIMPSTVWSRTTKRLIVVGLIIVLLLLFYLFRQLLPPIAIAIVLAYLLKPMADIVQRRTRMPRTLAVILVYLVVLLIISFIPVTVVPFAVDRFTRLNLDLQKLADDLVSFLSQSFYILGYRFSLEEIVGDVQGALQDLLRPFATGTVGFIFDVASSLLWILSIFVISFYLVKDAERLRNWLDRIAPSGYTEEFRHLREEINQVWKAFFRGQVVLGFVVGMVVWITMTIVGLPNAGLMGLLAGLLEVIPTFGPVLATIPALLIAFFLGSTYLPLSNFWFTVLVLGIYLVIQQTENAYLVPRIMGRRLQLHPVVVFVGVLAGGLIAGVLGVLLAAPIIGTLRVLLNYVYAKLLDQEPFSPEFAQTGEIYPGEIDAIFFDLDGTLIETDDEAMETLSRRLTPIKWLLPRRSTKEAARHIVMAWEGPANSLLTLLDRVGLDDNLLDLGDRLSRIRGLYTPMNFRPIDGVVEMLHDLSRRYQLGIVTTRSRTHAEAFLAQQGLAELIQVVTGREDTFRIKPHPSPILHTAEQLEVPVERCLMVGDTRADIWAARAAGARSVAVLCGFGQKHELERAGANKIIETTSQLQVWM
jgi:predicted PurR-regulated permease PerM/phosphoglycolate phosphatase-like HAD superfamily hydrolase